EQITPSSRHDLAKEVEDSCIASGGEKVISVEAGTSDSFNEQVFVTSNGFEGYRKTTIYSVGAEMTIQDEGDRRPNGYNQVRARMKKDLPDARKIGEETARRTFDLMGGKKIPTETLPIIIENRGVYRVLGGLINAMSGGNVQRKRSFLAEKKGEKIGSKFLNVIDDPFIEKGFGTRYYDNDGMKAVKRTMINEGELNDYYVNWYYSRKLGWEPTSGGPSNLVITPGSRSVIEIMKDLNRGIFISDFIGGNSNSTTGDASVGIIGHLFNNGEKEQAIAEMNIAFNHLDFWNKLVETGNDPYPYPFNSWYLPSLVFEDVVVSGK
ncbi:TldD/PmbA family protein, partial [Bacteroidota bacterium]